MAVKKFPPPPDTGRDNQKLNRWLIEIQSILNSGGLIPPGQVDGLPAVETQVVENTGDIATLQPVVAQNTTNIASLQGQVAQNTADIAALSAQIAALAKVLNGAGAPANGLGNVGDWYANTTGLHIYVKTGAAVWTIIV